VVAHDEFLVLPHLRLATIDTNLAWRRFISTVAQPRRVLRHSPRSSGICASLWWSDETSRSRPPRNLDTKPRMPTSLWAWYWQSLGKRRQRAHRRRFARPPSFQDRTDLKNRGRRERFKITSWLISRNGNDSENDPRNCTSRWQNPQTVFARHLKVLNLCRDSKRQADVIILIVA